MHALITSRNKPKVTIVIGKVKITKTGLTRRFKTDNTTATKSAVVKSFPVNSTPGKK